MIHLSSAQILEAIITHCLLRSSLLLSLNVKILPFLPHSLAQSVSAQDSDSSPADCRSPLSLVHTESRDRILVSDWSVVLTAPADCRRRGRRGLVWPYWPRVSCTVLISGHWPQSPPRPTVNQEISPGVFHTKFRRKQVCCEMLKSRKKVAGILFRGKATTFTLILKWKSWWIEWFVKVTDKRGLLMFLHIAFKAATKSIKQIFLQLDRSCLLAALPGSCLQSFVWSIISMFCQIWSSVTK